MRLLSLPNWSTNAYWVHKKEPLIPSLGNVGGYHNLSDARRRPFEHLRRTRVRDEQKDNWETKGQSQIDKQEHKLTCVWLTVGMRECKGMITNRSETKPKTLIHSFRARHWKTALYTISSSLIMLSNYSLIKLIINVLRHNIILVSILQCYLFTWSKHLLGQEQVIQTADIVPAREKDQDCPFLKQQRQNVTFIERQKQEQRVFHRCNNKQIPPATKKPLTRARASSELRAPCPLKSTVSTSAFSLTKAPCIQCQHHYSSHVSIHDRSCFTLTHGSSELSHQQYKTAVILKPISHMEEKTKPRENRWWR